MVSEDFRKAGQWLWPDDRAHPVSASRSSLAAAVLRLAGLRSVPRISRTAALSGVLAGKAGRAAAFGAGGALQADQAGGTQGDQRRIPTALGHGLSSPSKNSYPVTYLLSLSCPRERHPLTAGHVGSAAARVNHGGSAPATPSRGHAVLPKPRCPGQSPGHDIRGQPPAANSARSGGAAYARAPGLCRTDCARRSRRCRSPSPCTARS